MSRFLGIDYGTKRIGLAVGDDSAGVASPLETIEVRGGAADHARRVVDFAQAYEVDAFVIGLPVNVDGTEGKQAKITRRFGDQLEAADPRPIHYFGEHLSSVTARELLRSTGLPRKKQKAFEDTIAAQVILQEFLDAREQERLNQAKPPPGE